MSNRAIRFSVLGLTLVVLGVTVVLFRSSSAPASRPADPNRNQVANAGGRSDQRPPLTVDAFEVNPVIARNRIEVSGVLEPRREVVVGAEVPGRVISVEVEEHTPVTTGQPLVHLDPALPRAAVERARAAVLRAKSSEKLAASEVARQRELASRGVASAAELDRAESQDRSAAAQVEEAQAALLDAKTRLVKTEIRAPFSAVVSTLDLEPGAYLNPGEPVATLADISAIEIEVGLSDREILSVEDGDPVQVFVEASPTPWVEGYIVHPGRTPDPKTLKYPVAVRVANPDESLLPGMLGRVRFEIGPQRKTIWIPRRSVFSEFDLDYAYTIESPQGDPEQPPQATRRRIQTRVVPFRPEWLEVTAGLSAGDRIISSDLGPVREGRALVLRSTSREESIPSGTTISPTENTPITGLQP
ncbi:MAG: efflux RND transporter periplasmic adaptor subunit [Myxococcota bacterium]|nr:efflux RND transporter periplasmic adaptor subunit [Myxococcota bacterium]